MNDMDGETFTAFVTKYALTMGIMKIEKAHVSRGSPGMLCTPRSGYFHIEGKDWHRTEEAAYERADKMRAAKLSALKKQAARIQSMTFQVKDVAP